MKKKFRSYLKLGALLFGVSLVIISCQKDDFEPDQKQLTDTNQLGLTVQRGIKPDLSSNKDLLSKIDDINKKARSNRGSSREVYNAEMDFYVNTEEANYVEYGSYHSYTFPVYRNEDNGLIENLFLSLQSDGTYKSVLTQYNLTTEEIENYKNGIEVDLTDKINGIMIDDIGYTNNIMNRSDSCVQVYTESYCHNSAGHVIIDDGEVHGQGDPLTCDTSQASWDVTVYDFSFCEMNSGGGGGGTTSGTGTGPDSSNDTGTGPGGISGTGTGPGSGDPDDNTGDNSNGNGDSEDECLQVSIDGDCFEDTGVLILPPRPEPDPDPCSNSLETIEKLNELLNDSTISQGITDMETHLASGFPFENGLEFSKDSNGGYSTVFPIGIGYNETVFSNPPVSNSKMRIHVHHNELSPAPTWHDTFTEFPSYFHDTNDSEVVDMMLSTGGLYAFTVYNSEVLEAMYNDIHVEEGSNGEPLNPLSVSVNRQNILEGMEKEYFAKALDYHQEHMTTANQYEDSLEASYKKFIKKIEGKYPGAIGYFKATKVNGVYQWECINLNN